jgi:hypothetical protein
MTVFKIKRNNRKADACPSAFLFLRLIQPKVILVTFVSHGRALMIPNFIKKEII